MCVHVTHVIRFLFAAFQAAGNEAFQSGKYLEAVEYYTTALMSNGESLRFLAVCLCNRAAAYQAMGQILDAIADCSLAIALDADYARLVYYPPVVLVSNKNSSCNYVQ